MTPETTARLLRQTASTEPIWVPVTGLSMGRAITGGSRVLVAAVKRPRWGEVWAFCAPDGAIVVHRSRGRRRRGWVFEGDAVGRADPEVPSDRLIGRVLAVDENGNVRSLGRADAVAGAVAIWARRIRRATARIAGGARTPAS